MRLESTRLVYGFMIEGSDITKYAKRGDWFKQYVIERTEEDDDDEPLTEDYLWEDFITYEVFDGALHDFITGLSFEDSLFVLGPEINEDTFTAEYINSFIKTYQEEIIDGYRYFMGFMPDKEPQFYLFNAI